MQALFSSWRFESYFRQCRAGFRSPWINGENCLAKLDPVSALLTDVDPTPESLSSGENPPTAWVMYDNDDRMSVGLGTAVATFPAESDPAFHTSGLAIGVDELANTAAIVDKQIGYGRVIVFSFDPNSRNK